MTDSNLFNSNNESNDDAPRKSNVPEFSVGELAFSLKKTLEDNFGRVRVRGELSRVSIAGSGHMYSALKDNDAVIDAVCWKGVMNKLSIRPEEGLEVIIVGRITTYPKSSKYQLVIESMELAGEGALLKMLEERKKKLSAEGLFSDERKQRLPFIPNVIGVVTSPTGAVIRDILHRLSDRFPRHVVVWPVLVQGDGAADQVTRAIQGFDNMSEGGVVAKPDLIIVARGGGSLEDLMAFNEENVVRAIAECKTPIISAVGHETDTTLADYAADLRAPTPTASAEMAVPHRRDLMAQVLDDEKRLLNGLTRLSSEYRHRLEAQSAKLGDPSKLLESKMQSIDFLGDKIRQVFKGFVQTKTSHVQQVSARLLNPSQMVAAKGQNLARIADQLGNVFANFVINKESQLQRVASKITDPKHSIAQMGQRLDNWNARLVQTAPRLVEKKSDQLESYSRLLGSLSYEGILSRGYAVVRDADNKPLTDPSMIAQGQGLQLEFSGDHRVDVTAEKANADVKPSSPFSKKPSSKPKPDSKPKPETNTDQGALF